MKKYKFVGMCQCPINNPKQHATHTAANCPLHGYKEKRRTMWAWFCSWFSSEDEAPIIVKGGRY